MCAFRPLWRAGAVQQERRLQDEGAAQAAWASPTTPSASLLAALTNPSDSPSPPPAPAPAAAAEEEEEEEEEFGFGFDGDEDGDEDDAWGNEMETEPAAAASTRSSRSSRASVNSEASSETGGAGRRLSHISLAGFSDAGDIDADRESLITRGVSGRSVFSVTSNVRHQPCHRLSPAPPSSTRGQEAALHQPLPLPPRTTPLPVHRRHTTVTRRNCRPLRSLTCKPS